MIGRRPSGGRWRGSDQPADARIATIRSSTPAAIVRLSARGRVTAGSPTANRVTALVSCWKPVASALTSLATIRSSCLRSSFDAGVRLEVVGLGREADERLPGRLVGTQPGEDVGGRLEHDLGRAVVLLELVIGRIDRTEVGHRRRHHDDVAGRGEPLELGLHLGRGLDTHDLDADRRRPVDRRHERHLRTAARRFLGDRVSLLAAAAVGDDAHGVDRLARAAGADDHLETVHVGRCEQSVDGGDDRLGRGQPALAGIAAGETAPIPARRRARHASAAWRCCRPPPGAPTSRCASPGRSSPAPAWRAARSSAGRSTIRRGRRR